MKANGAENAKGRMQGARIKPFQSVYRVVSESEVSRDSG